MDRVCAQETRHERPGRRCIAIAGDVKDPAFCDQAAGQTLRAFGRSDILVNNAAFQQLCASLEALSEEHLQETLQTRIGGYVHMTRAVLPHLEVGSCIINSDAGQPAQPKEISPA